MPLNVPGLLVPIQLLWFPRVILPSLSVKDIRQLDFVALKNAGFRGAVFDKDNCLTIPHEDKLIPELQEAWTECRKVFGKGNVIVVSNSAGTQLDGGGIQAESVSYHLKVPVLNHNSFKPSYSCIQTIRHYFASLPNPIPDEQLVIVGDRLFTDMVVANRMRTWKGWRHLLETWKQKEQANTALGNGPLGVWTTGVWKKESMGMRWGEAKLLELVTKWSRPPLEEPKWDASRFTRQTPLPSKSPEKDRLSSMLRMLGFR
ncbi:HAD-superfamily phosphatase [Cylindrobasidium torrendii FP15055 ss-10]|uniref:HAD-superfamily phosphatase n=1 Tax=Cylindrobasidium torrendii FP15055 ss-10 TaxID=1314674 RepID=A0A0D7B4A0_9AGAR|nr:HAD-superfamily phosphatase [Cylindrobasidium torrendii FP15055 ss-10]